MWGFLKNIGSHALRSLGLREMPNYGRYYVSNHEVTLNYLSGLKAMDEHRVEQAISILEREPEDSTCYVLARGNIALALNRLNRYSVAEAVARQTLDLIRRQGCPHPPSEVQFYRNLAEAIACQGRWAEAISFYDSTFQRADELARSDPEHATAVQLEKAHAFGSRGNSHLYCDEWDEAIAHYNLARDVYQAYPEDERVGHAEVLTNMAYALMHSGRRLDADLALKEALNIADATGDVDQIFRVRNAAYQLNSDTGSDSDAFKEIEDGAEAALRDNRVATAYVRFCIGASCARDAEDSDVGLRFVERARSIERELEPRDPNVPKLRMVEAALMEIAEHAPSEIRRVLIEGASLWYETIAGKLVDEDFRNHTRSLHGHFRMLARYLLDSNALEEAVMAFEAGRALHYSVAVEPTFFSRAISENPFAADGSAISTSVFRQARARVATGEVAVVLAHIPPQLVAFVIDGKEIQVVTEELPETQEELDELDREIGMIPHRLTEGKGGNAIPEIFSRLAVGIQASVDERIVRGFTPYGRFHLIPWRTLLRVAGAQWPQLAFPITFGFLLHHGKPEQVQKPDLQLFAMGCGGAPDIDFQEEANACARAFGARAQSLSRCRGSDLRTALMQPGITLLSSHGLARRDGRNVSTSFHLYNELRTEIVPTPVEQVIPDVVQSLGVILSTCESGVYEMAWGDEPAGAAPLLLRRGARFCIGTRFPIRAMFASRFFPKYTALLADGSEMVASFVRSLQESEESGEDLWRDIACLEILSQ